MCLEAFCFISPFSEPLIARSEFSALERGGEMIGTRTSSRQKMLAQNGSKHLPLIPQKRRIKGRHLFLAGLSGNHARQTLDETVSECSFC